MDVLVVGLDPLPVAISASRASASRARRRRAARGVEAPGVHGGRLAVVGQQLGVVRAQEGGDGRIERAPDPARPERHAVVFARLRAAASSTSSDAILTKPSAAAWGNVSPAPYDASCSA